MGTDHGYVPAELALRGYRGNLIASDIRSEPLASARRTAAEYGVSDKIRFVLCPGLSGCDKELVDTVVIAGMGGDTISMILDETDWAEEPGYRFILQPMTKNEVLRYYLINNGFVITGEELVRDNGTVYQIITAVYNGSNCRLRDFELYAGVVALQERNELYRENLSILKKRFEYIASRSGTSSRRNDVRRREFYENMIREMENEL